MPTGFRCVNSKFFHSSSLLLSGPAPNIRWHRWDCSWGTFKRDCDRSRGFCGLRLHLRKVGPCCFLLELQTRLTDLRGSPNGAWWSAASRVQHCDCSCRSPCVCFRELLAGAQIYASCLLACRFDVPLYVLWMKLHISWCAGKTIRAALFVAAIEQN